MRSRERCAGSILSCVPEEAPTSTRPLGQSPGWFKLQSAQQLRFDVVAQNDPDIS